MPTFQEVAEASVQARDRIRQHIYETPLIPAKKIGRDSNANVLFKAENFQLTGSFKLRGAMSKLSVHGEGQLITASSGNHGIASALASQSLSKKLTVVLPEIVIPAKLKKIEAYGVDVILHGVEAGLAEQHAQQLASSGTYTYVSPYNDLHIVAGQGTIGLELLEQHDHIDNIFISMGGGGLISGVGSVLKVFSPRTKVYGVSAAHTKVLAESMAAGHVVETEHLPTIAEAVAGGMDKDSITLALATAVVDELIECDESEIIEALKMLALSESMIVEGSAALALAGFNSVASKLSGQTSVIVLCGSNYDQEKINKIIFGPLPIPQS
ncbi:threonine dehydratase catabolic [Fusarium avenaceum]|nr:threonine dehydratase catabolic [Fusarium avenaceum]